MENWEIVDMEEKKTNDIIILSVYSIGFTYIRGNLIFTNKWFKRINVKLRKYKVRYKEFDEWDYNTYWGSWFNEWRFLEIVK